MASHTREEHIPLTDLFDVLMRIVQLVEQWQQELTAARSGPDRSLTLAAWIESRPEPQQTHLLHLLAAIDQQLTQAVRLVYESTPERDADPEHEPTGNPNITRVILRNMIALYGQTKHTDALLARVQVLLNLLGLAETIDIVGDGSRLALFNEQGFPVTAPGSIIPVPGGLMGQPSDEVSRRVREAIARPDFLLNEALHQVELRFPLDYRLPNGTIEQRQAQIIYTPPGTRSATNTDAILGQILQEARTMDTLDLLLHALIMNGLVQHGPEGFPFGPETIRHARMQPPSGLPKPEDLLDLDARLQKQASLAVYVPDGNMYISGKYYRGSPLLGGAIVNIGPPVAFLPTLNGTLIPAAWHVQPGPVGLFLLQEFGPHGRNPQFGLYPQEVFALNIYHRDGAFRLALHIAPMWRIRAGRDRHGQLEATWHPRNLFTQAGIALPADRRNFDSWLQRRHADLDALVDARFLQRWDWTPAWAADMALEGQGRPRGWFTRLLDEGRLLLEPHPNILRQYAAAGLPEAKRYLQTGDRAEAPSQPVASPKPRRIARGKRPPRA